MRFRALTLATLLLTFPSASHADESEPYPNDPNANTNTNTSPNPNSNDNANGNGNGNANANANGDANGGKGGVVEGCGCSAKKEENDDRWREKVGVSGLRVSAWRVRGSAFDRQGWGLAFAGNSTDVRTRDGVARMARIFFSIGGGNGGFEGAFGGLIAGGVRLDAAPDQGAVLRLGLQGWLQGNEHFYSSHFEFPVLQLGWQYARSLTMLEVGAQGGPVLAGRYDPEGAFRKLGGQWEGTGYLSFHFPHARFDATFTRYWPDSTDTASALEIARATMCGLAKPLGICADLSTWQGGVQLFTGEIRTARTIYGGFLIGVSER